MPDQLPCGCTKSGLMCREHAPNPSISRFIAHEAATLVSLALFTALVAVMAGLWAFPS